MKTIKLNVEGMSCGHCVNSIENGLKSKKAIAKVDLKNKKVEVIFDEKDIKEEAIKSLITELGYQIK